MRNSKDTSDEPIPRSVETEIKKSPEKPWGLMGYLTDRNGKAKESAVEILVYSLCENVYLNNRQTRKRQDYCG